MKKVCLLFFVSSFFLLSCREDAGSTLSEGKGNIIIKANTNNEVESIITRSEEDYSEYWVDIVGPQSLSKPLIEGNFEVLSGNYTVTLTSMANHEDALPEFELPVYQGSTNVVVPVDDDVLAEIICKQINAGVRFIFDQGVKDYFTEGFVVRLEDNTDSDKHIEYINFDDATAYFMPATLKMTLKNGTNPVKIGGANYTTINVEARQVWTITLKTSSTKPGSIEMTVTVAEEDVEKVNPEFGIGVTVGDGTFEDPYSVSDAINAMPVEGVWVQGYVTRTITRASNGLLIAAKEGADDSECILIDIPALSALNNIPENTVIKLKGNVTGGTDASLSTLAYMTGITDFQFEGCERGPNNGNPITAYGQTLKDVPVSTGAIIRSEWATNGSDYMHLLNRDFDRITAEYEMTMGYNEGDDYSNSDAIVSIATANNIQIHGRALIWNKHFSAGILTQTAAIVKQIVNAYITTTVDNYRNQVKSWDVVTEAFNADGSLNTTLSYYSKLGADYIKTAFTTARAAAASDCKLFLDESGLVGNPTKLNAIINAMTALNTETQLVDGIGVQMSLTAGISKATIKATIDAITSAGFIVHISSLEVTGSDETLRAQTYKDVFDCMKDVPANLNWGVTLAGVSDQYSGGNSLLFDSENKAKQAYFDIINSFE